MSQFLAEVLREALRNGAYVVKFHKVDGTEREMVCTTKHDLIAEAAGRDLTPGPLREDSTKSPDLLTVYDCHLGQWRSFYASKVTSFEPLRDLDGAHITEPL